MTQATMTTSISHSRQNMEAYFNTHDVQYVADDAVFINMSSGERTEGREAIKQLLHLMYHQAFDAVAEVKNFIITEDKALLEARFKGTHIGEIAGMPATNKKVDVPLSVAYNLEGGLIKEARVYMLMDVMMKQLSGT